VTSTPAGIDCGTTCMHAFASGQMVTLTAAVIGDSTFAGWMGACTGTGACVVTLDQARMVTATFTLNQYTLRVSKPGTGLGAVTSTPAGIDCGATCGAQFDSGTVVSLTAVATTGSTFAGWSGGGCSGTGGCNVTMTTAQNVAATFTCDPGSATFNYTGAVQTFTVPACVTQLGITAFGAEGGASPALNAVGGLGGKATGNLTVAAGQTLYVYVGKRGTNSNGDNTGVPGVFGGGGAGGTSIGGASQPGGASGGGASDVRATAMALTDRVIVAAGGGGAAGGTSGGITNGGAGGGPVGGNGVSYASGVGFEAKGGTQTAGGAAGSYAYAAMTGGTAGSLGLGGDGWGGGYSGGGGGGGGYYGGGGGSTHFESGGGGGSSYLGGVAAGATTAGVRSGDGLVTLTW
jgi:hypothetical protein